MCYVESSKSDGPPKICYETPTSISGVLSHRRAKFKAQFRSLVVRCRGVYDRIVWDECVYGMIVCEILFVNGCLLIDFRVCGRLAM